MKHLDLRSTLLSAALLLACDDKPKPGQFPLSPQELTRGAASGDDAETELLYKRYCIGCHADDGRGNGGTTGADLTAADGPLAKKPDAELIASVRDGRLGKTATMPPHKPVLKDPQIAALVRYLRQRFGRPAPSP